MPDEIPLVIDEENEPSKFLHRLKTRVLKNFLWTHRRSVEDAMYLAYWLHIFGEDDQSLALCDFLSAWDFNGDTNAWANIEGTLALRARYWRMQGRSKEAATPMQRVRFIMYQTYSPGVPEERLDGIVLQRYEQLVRDTVESGFGKTGERNCWLMVLKEQSILIELGGSASFSVEMLEAGYQESKERLRLLAR